MKPVKKARKGLVEKKRFKAGTVAKRQYLRLSKSTTQVLQKAPFSRLIRNEVDTFKSGLRCSPGALEMLQEATERHIHDLVKDANIVAAICKSKTLNIRHIAGAQRARECLTGGLATPVPVPPKTGRKKNGVKKTVTTKPTAASPPKKVKPTKLKKATVASAKKAKSPVTKIKKVPAKKQKTAKKAIPKKKVGKKVQKN
eukprot:TRINITY_DN11853_c6_g1_i1.p1 TRINITY_DN11853_c6_g1~~TRINITY_DN11853_c6_g1_i1.p1  ORF type:complete len:216 (+),score=48.92 TRINITY_DN11853_c6_g1_i1:53-649(+)